MLDPILIDVDDVLCDLDAAVLPLINRVTGKSFTREDHTTWSYKQSFALTDAQDREVRDHMQRAGFCWSLPVAEGAREALDALRGLRDVVAVTSPTRGRHWAGERLEWLRGHLDFAAEDVVQADRKSLVCGAMLIDDRLTNLRDWRERWRRPVVLWDRPFNQGLVETYERAVGWNELIKCTIRALTTP